VNTNEYNEALNEAQATVEADQIYRAMEEGTLTFGEYSPAESEQILASLPTEVDLAETTVPTSVRLPYPVYQRLRAYAEEHHTTASTLIRQWVEQMLTVPDRPISLADAVRVLSTLPSEESRPAA
jgi:predicted DNA-binding protein